MTHKKKLCQKHPFLFLLVFLLVVSRPSLAQKALDNIPHLKKHGTATQLVVQNKPFLMLAGELGNSSASSMKYLRPYWQSLKKMNLNTILAPVYWELMEPQEGKFDFSLIDSLILSARHNNLKLVFLWFGTWKNSMSCYVPSWVKTDQERFPRAKTKERMALEILTPFNEENRNADARAFSALMKHIHAIDANKNTVIMMQVENEIGMIPEARDYCEIANQSFEKPVPIELLNWMQNNINSLTPELKNTWQTAGSKTSGSWEEIFGKGLQTDEIFMAWHFAQYTNYVAEAGKKEYSLPMYVNAALIRPGYKPGQYPSAGPLPHLIDIWHAGAPRIDFLSPDIYFKNFSEWCKRYNRNDNPLFIPETGNNQSITSAFYAIAQHNAMGYSPFSIESLEHPENNQVSRGYKVLKQLSTLILEHQGQGTMAGVLLDSITQNENVILGNYVFNFKHEYSWSYTVRSEGPTPRVGGMIIMLSEDEFIIVGSGIIVTFETNSQNGMKAGINQMDEVEYTNAKWNTGRRMNGDQSHQGRHMHLPGNTYSMQKVKLYMYK